MCRKIASGTFGGQSIHLGGHPPPLPLSQCSYVPGTTFGCEAEQVKVRVWSLPYLPTLKGGPVHDDSTAEVGMRQLHLVC